MDVLKVWSAHGAKATPGRVGVTWGVARSLVSRAVWGADGVELERKLRGRSLRDLEMDIAAAVGRAYGPEAVTEVRAKLVAKEFLTAAKKSEAKARVAQLRREAEEMAASAGVDLRAVWRSAAKRVAKEARPVSHPSYRGHPG